ncbi:adenylate/guanylate cyclase domain-containing protein [Mycolicibacterium hippocampi]|uniref:adenylate/guanylate cyclase domain-containing protein n=1 Tax=Mycolicibacterium hippocampi TaxID=659824 RepID=UPI003512C518
MVTQNGITIALAVVVALQFAGLVALGILLLLSRRTLADTRKQLRRQRDRAAANPSPPRRRPSGVAPRAVRTVVHTLQGADSLIRKGIVGSVRSSVEDLAGWARVERPDLARITSDGRVVLVFSDIEGSTERNEALGDRAWVKVLEGHNELVERRVAAHQGYVVKNQGDGFMIAFARPDEALRCSVSVQQALRDDPQRYDGIRVRIGAHAGSSVRRGDDLFGRDVAMAARIADLADGGEILVSHALREAVTEAVDISFDEPIEVELKGLNGTQTVYAVDIPAGH